MAIGQRETKGNRRIPFAREMHKRRGIHHMMEEKSVEREREREREREDKFGKRKRERREGRRRRRRGGRLEVREKQGDKGREGKK